MRNFLYIVIVAAILVFPWQYSLYKERRAKNYVDKIEQLYRSGAYDEALSHIRRMPRLYQDRVQLLAAQELEKKIDKTISQIKLDSLENEKRLLLSQNQMENRGTLDSIEQERQNHLQTVKAIERREAENSARCQCVTTMRNMRRPVYGRIDTLLRSTQ